MADRGGMDNFLQSFATVRSPVADGGGMDHFLVFLSP